MRRLSLRVDLTPQELAVTGELPRDAGTEQFPPAAPMARIAHDPSFTISQTGPCSHVATSEHGPLEDKLNLLLESHC